PCPPVIMIAFPSSAPMFANGFQKAASAIASPLQSVTHDSNLPVLLPARCYCRPGLIVRCANVFGMVTQAERAMSFGAIAVDYDRLRASPPAEAIRWLLPAGAALVAHLAPGTGQRSPAAAP